MLCCLQRRSVKSWKSWVFEKQSFKLSKGGILVSKQAGISILVVEDDKVWQNILKNELGQEGYAVQIAASFDEAVSALEQRRFFLSIVDVKLNATDFSKDEGIQFVAHLARYGKNTRAIILTGYGTIEQATKVMTEYGVLDYFEKGSFDAEKLKFGVRKAHAPLQKLRCFKTGGDCTRDIRVKPNQVFVAMPYSWDKLNMSDVYEFGIKGALQELGYEPLRADEVFLGRDLMCNICQHIQESPVGVVDISDWNPNVLLELGMMYGWGKTVILLKYGQSDTHLPADLRGMLYLEYDSVRSLKAKLITCFGDLEY